jgi:hypothetical protein
MAFIDNTYFINEIRYPNVTRNMTVISEAIAVAEKKALTMLLGYELYSLLIADLTSNNLTSKRFIDFVNGADFVVDYNGREVKQHWNGLKNEDKVSMLAYFAYIELLTNEATNYTDVGNVVMKSETGDRVSPVDKICQASQLFVNLYGQMPISYRKPIFAGETMPVMDIEPSAYNFLLANIDDYPEWIFTPYHPVNRFGI